jgi:hypothetical protein
MASSRLVHGSAKSAVRPWTLRVQSQEKIVTIGELIQAGKNGRGPSGPADRSRRVRVGWLQVGGER